ncbi:MAG TPA: hypothetical protein PLY40_03300 [Bacillota bacterium]|nr:hypothetical protein [Bacillota bacterium]
MALIELLAALAILGFVIGSLYTFYFAGLNSFDRSISRMDSQQSARIAMDKIISELRYAYFIDLSSGQEADAIHFKVKGDSRTHRFRHYGQEEIVFESLYNNKIDAHTKIALGITALHFTVDETNTIFITISAGSEPAKVTLTGAVRPRNLP